MAGKPKADPNAPDNRGGKREGSGPKKMTKMYSDALRKDVDRNVRAKAKETGKTYGRVLVDLAWNDEIPVQFRSPYIKLIAEIQTIKETSVEVDTVRDGPIVYLPKVMEEPKESGGE